MPGRRGPPPAPPDLPCGANFPAVPPFLAENGCALSKPACDVVFRPFVGRVGKYLFGLIELDHLAQQKKAGKLRHSRRLLHIVGHDHDRNAP